MTKARAVELLKENLFCCNFEECNNAWDCDECVDALNMAIEALENKVLCLGELENKCKHCTVKGETTHYCYCDMWNSIVEPYGWCNYGERDETE